MKLLLASLILISANAFSGESEWCWGGPYWALMDKSQRICNYQEQVFGNANGLSCHLRYHSDPNVCYSECRDVNGKLTAKLRVDMTSDCSLGLVYFIKNKITWLR
jgi:hypothetical protein